MTMIGLFTNGCILDLRFGTYLPYLHTQGLYWCVCVCLLISNSTIPQFPETLLEDGHRPQHRFIQHNKKKTGDKHCKHFLNVYCTALHYFIIQNQTKPPPYHIILYHLIHNWRRINEHQKTKVNILLLLLLLLMLSVSCSNMNRSIDLI